MAVDLHTHSSASDGSDTPDQLVRLAKATRLRALALTDHDTQEGIASARVTADELGLQLIPGVEISLEWGKGGMHLVALWLEPGPGPLQDRLTELQLSRTYRNGVMVERLQQLGLDITVDEVLAEAGEGSVGRPHMAAVLLRKGYVTDIQQAFTDYLGNSAPAYVGRMRLDPEEAIRLSLESGSVPVLAHPHTLGIDNSAEMANLMERLVAAGLVGIECHYGTYEVDGRRGMEAMARRFGLVPSGGSDYHGSYKPDVGLGKGRVGVGIPDRVLTELEASRDGR